MDNPIIELKTAPIIEYSKLNTISLEVEKKIQDLKLDEIEATEENVKVLKDIRSELNKESKAYEDDRKKIKKLVLAPYEDFETSYKDLILSKYNDADIKLKNAVDSVENELRAKRKNELSEYFEELKLVEKIDFIEFENVGLNITLSATDKSLRTQINEFVEKIKNDLVVIESSENKVRILAKYQQNLDLSKSIIEVNNETKFETEFKKEQEVSIEKKVVYKSNNLSRENYIFEADLNSHELTKIVDYLLENGITYSFKEGKK